MIEAVKRTALSLMRRGEATPGQVAELAGVSRMTAYRWAVDAGIDCDQAMRERLLRVWKRTNRPAKVKPTKKRLRQIADEAKVGWDQAHGEIGELYS